MPLVTKCILADPSTSDGLRISVMSRHTLNDGKTPHPDIHENCFDEWIKILAPHPKLVGAYYRQELEWDEFAVKYTESLSYEDKSPAVTELATRALQENVTIMCIEHTPERCHRRLLAEECQRRFPELVLSLE